MEGRPVDPLATGTSRASVFVFTRTDCPISNRYAPEVERIRSRFASRGVSFWLVYVDPDEGAAAIREHLQEYGYSWGALRDPEHALVAHTGARVTPEAAVFVPEPGGARMVYRGRIDDRYVDFGKSRAEASTHDLERKLETILAGEAVSLTTTRAVGCFIADLA
jgi:hypothetical protein